MNIGTLTASLGIDTGGLNQAKQDMEGFKKSVETSMKDASKATKEAETNLKQYSDASKNFAGSTSSQMKTAIDDQKKAIQDLSLKIKELTMDTKDSTKSVMEKMNATRNLAGVQREMIGEQQALLGMQKQLKDSQEAEKAATESSAGGIDGMIGILGGWALGLASVSAAMKIGKEIIASTEGSMHAYEQVVQAAEASVTYFFKSIASGDWTNFFEGLKVAQDSAMEFVTQMEIVNNLKNEHKVRSAEQQGKVQMGWEAYYANKGVDDVKAAEALRTIIKETIADKTEGMNIAKKEYQDTLGNIAATNKMHKDTVESLVIEYSKHKDMIEEGEKLIKMRTDANQIKYGQYDMDAVKAWQGITDEQKKVLFNTEQYLKLTKEEKGQVADLAASYKTLQAQTIIGPRRAEMALNTIENKPKHEAALAAKESAKELQDILAGVTKGEQKIATMQALFGKETDSAGIKFKSTQEYVKLYASAIEALAGKVSAANPIIVKMLQDLEKYTKLARGEAMGAAPTMMASRLAMAPVAMDAAARSKYGVAGTATEAAVGVGGLRGGLEKPMGLPGQLKQAIEDQKELNKQIKEEHKLRNQTFKAIEQYGQLASTVLNSYTALLQAQTERQMAGVDKVAKMQGKSAEWVTKEKERIQAESNKKQKQAAIAEAMINIAIGVTKAIAQGGVLGIITGAVVMAAGMMQIATINAQKMASGGVIPSGYSNDTYPALLSSGETVVPPGKLPAMAGEKEFKLLRVNVAGRDLEYVYQEQRKLQASY